jgi:signal peptidase I
MDTDVLDTLREMAREQPVSVTVRGGCMTPRIAEGDRVEVAPARFYWPGDVIVFKAADGRWLVHRLLGWRWWQGRLAAVTRGDGCPCHDAPVPFGQVLGRVVPGRVTAAGRLRAAAAFLRLALRRVLRSSR